MYVNNTVCCTAKWNLFISWWDSKEPATPTLDSCGSPSKNEGIYPGAKDMLLVEISLRGFIHSSTFCWNKFDLFLQMKQKIQTTKAASFLSNDVSEITDEPLKSSSTISQQESTQAQSRWKSDKHITKTEESLLAELEARSQQMMVLNQQVLERIKPSVGKERDAFVDWLRSAINDLDHDVWRRCQQQIMTSGGVASNRSAIHFTNILLTMIDWRDNRHYLQPTLLFHLCLNSQTLLYRGLHKPVPPCGSHHHRSGRITLLHQYLSGSQRMAIWLISSFHTSNNHLHNFSLSDSHLVGKWMHHHYISCRGTILGKPSQHSVSIKFSTQVIQRYRSLSNFCIDIDSFICYFYSVKANENGICLWFCFQTVIKLMMISFTFEQTHLQLCRTYFFVIIGHINNVMQVL